MPTSKTRTTRKAPVRKTTTAARKPVRKAGAKNFGFKTSSSGAATRTGDEIPFYLGDDDDTAYYIQGGVDDEGLGVISAEITRAEQLEDFGKIGQSLLDVLDALFVPDTAATLLRKVKDRGDPFRFAELTMVIEWAIEQVGERPTTSSRI